MATLLDSQSPEHLLTLINCDSPSEIIVSTIKQVDQYLDANADQLEDTEAALMLRFSEYAFHHDQNVSSVAQHFITKLINSEQFLIDSGAKQASTCCSQKSFSVFMDYTNASYKNGFESNDFVQHYLYFCFSQQPNTFEMPCYKKFIRLIADKAGQFISVSQLLQKLFALNPDAVLVCFGDDSIGTQLIKYIQTQVQSIMSQLSYENVKECVSSINFLLSFINESQKFTECKAQCQALIVDSLTDLSQGNFNMLQKLETQQLFQFLNALSKSDHKTNELALKFSTLFQQNLEKEQLIHIGQFVCNILLQKIVDQDYICIILENLLMNHVYKSSNKEVQGSFIQKLVKIIEFQEQLGYVQKCKITTTFQRYYEYIVNNYLAEIQSLINSQIYSEIQNIKNIYQVHFQALEIKLNTVTDKIIVQFLQTLWAKNNTLMCDTYIKYKYFNQEDPITLMQCNEQFQYYELLEDPIMLYLKQLIQSNTYFVFIQNAILSWLRKQTQIVQLQNRFPYTEIGDNIDLDEKLFITIMRLHKQLLASSAFSKECAVKNKNSIIVQFICLQYVTIKPVLINQLVLYVTKFITENKLKLSDFDLQLTVQIMRQKLDYFLLTPIQFDQRNLKTEDFMSLLLPQTRGIDFEKSIDELFAFFSIFEKNQHSLEVIVYVCFNVLSEQKQCDQLLLQAARVILFGRNLSLKVYFLQQIVKRVSLFDSIFLGENLSSTQHFVLSLKYLLSLGSIQMESLTNQATSVKQVASQTQGGQTQGTQSMHTEQIMMQITQVPFIQQFQLFFVTAAQLNGSRQTLFEQLVDSSCVSPFLDTPSCYQELNYLNQIQIQPFQLRHIHLSNNQQLSPSSLAEQASDVLGKLGTYAQTGPNNEMYCHDEQQSQFEFNFVKMMKDKQENTNLNKYKLTNDVDFKIKSSVGALLTYYTNYLLKQQAVDVELFIRDKEQPYILKEIFDFEQWVWNNYKTLIIENKPKFLYTLLLFSLSLSQFQEKYLGFSTYINKDIFDELLPQLMQIIIGVQNDDYLVYSLNIQIEAQELLGNLKEYIDKQKFTSIIANLLNQYQCNVNLAYKLFDVIIKMQKYIQIQEINKLMSKVVEKLCQKIVLTPIEIQLLCIFSNIIIEKAEDVDYEFSVINKLMICEIQKKRIELTLPQHNIDDYSSMKQYIATLYVNSESRNELCKQLIDQFKNINSELQQAQLIKCIQLIFSQECTQSLKQLILDTKNTQLIDAFVQIQYNIEDAFELINESTSQSFQTNLINQLIIQQLLLLDVQNPKQIDIQLMQFFSMFSSNKFVLNKDEEDKIFQKLENIMEQLNENQNNLEFHGTIINLFLNQNYFEDALVELLAAFVKLYNGQLIQKYIQHSSIEYYSQLQKIDDKYFPEIMQCNYYTIEYFNRHITKIPKLSVFNKELQHYHQKYKFISLQYDELMFDIGQCVQSSKIDQIVEDLCNHSSNGSIFGPMLKLNICFYQKQVQEFSDSLTSISDDFLIQLTNSKLLRVLSQVCQISQQVNIQNLKKILNIILLKLLKEKIQSTINQLFVEIITNIHYILLQNVDNKEELLQEAVNTLNVYFYISFQQNKQEYQGEWYKYNLGDEPRTTYLVYQLLVQINNVYCDLDQRFKQKSIISNILYFLIFLISADNNIDPLFQLTQSLLANQDVQIKFKQKMYVNNCMGYELSQIEFNTALLYTQYINRCPVLFNQECLLFFSKQGILIYQDNFNCKNLFDKCVAYYEKQTIQQMTICQYYRTQIIQQIVSSAFNFFELQLQIYSLSTFLTAQSSQLQPLDFQQTLFLNTFSEQHDSKIQLEQAVIELKLRMQRVQQEVSLFEHCIDIMHQMKLNNQYIKSNLINNLIGSMYGYIINAPQCYVEASKVLTEPVLINQYVNSFIRMYNLFGQLLQIYSATIESSDSGNSINEFQLNKYLTDELSNKISNLRLPAFLSHIKDKLELQSRQMQHQTVQAKEQFVQIQVQNAVLIVQQSFSYSITDRTDFGDDFSILTEFEAWNSSNAFILSCELLIGYIEIIRVLSKLPNALIYATEERWKKLIQYVGTQCQQVYFCPSATFSINSLRMRLYFEEIILNKTEKWQQKILPQFKLSGFTIRIENSINQLLQFVSDFSLWQMWLTQKKSPQIPQNEYQEKIKQYWKEIQRQFGVASSYFQKDQEQLDQAMQPLELPLAEIWEFSHWALTQNTYRQNRLSHVSNIMMQILVLSCRLPTKIKESISTEHTIMIDDMIQLKFVLRCLMLNSDFASQMYLQFTEQVFSKINYVSDCKSDQIIQCTHSHQYHNFIENNQTTIQFQKGMLSVLLTPQLSSQFIRNQLPKIITKTLLSNHTFPFDNYFLIMLTDNYQQKPFSSDVTKLGYIQQVKTVFQNNKEKGQVKRWSYQMGHYLPAISTQYQLNYSVCLDSQNIENTMLVEKLYNAGTPHCEATQYTQFQQQQQNARQNGQKQTNRNIEMKHLFEVLASVIALLKSHQDYDINSMLDLSKMVCFDLINKNDKNEDAFKQLVSDGAIEQGSLGAVYYEAYLLLIICYQQLYLQIIKQYLQKPIESLRSLVDDTKKQLDEAEKKIQLADRTIKKSQQDIKEIEATLMSLFLKQDQLLRNPSNPEQNEKDIQQNESELKSSRKKSEEAHSEQNKATKEIDQQNQYKLRQQSMLIKQMMSALEAQVQNKNSTLNDMCVKFTELNGFFDKYYRLDIEQHQIINQMFLNEKIAQRLVCSMYSDLNEQEAVFGLLYPTQLKQHDGKQFMFSVANKKLYEVNSLKAKDSKPILLQNKIFDRYSKYCITFDNNHLSEKQYEENRITSFKCRPMFYWLGMQGDAMNFIINQCLLKSNPTPDYYAMYYNQMIGMHQDAVNKMQKSDIVREQQQQQPNDITGNLNEMLKKYIRKIANGVLKQCAKQETTIQKMGILMKYTALFDNHSLNAVPDNITKEIEKQEQVKASIVIYERDAFQNLMYEKLIVSLLETNQFKDLDAIGKDMRDEYIKKQYRSNQNNAFYVQISKFKLFMDKMTKKIRESSLKMDEQKSNDIYEWIQKFSTQIETQELQENSEKQQMHFMNQQFICQVIALLNSVFPGQFNELHGIFIPGSAVYSSVFNSIIENEENRQEGDKLTELYTKAYSSPIVDQELDYDYWITRKIYESYAIFAALYPNLAIEIILKQGTLRRAIGESIITEKKEILQRPNINNCKLNAGDASLFSPLVLFLIQSYTPSSMAPGANLVFIEKQKNQSDQNSMIKDLEMVNFEEYQKSCQELGHYVLQQVSSIIGQEPGIKLGSIENSYQSDASMTQYQVETLMFMINFAFLNFIENQQLIHKLILLFRDQLVSGFGRKSLFSTPLCFRAYHQYKNYYCKCLMIYQLIRESYGHDDINQIAQQIQQIVQETVQDSIYEQDLQQSIRGLASITQLNQLFISSVQYIVAHQSLNCNPLFQMLKQQLQNFRINSINELMQHSLANGDPLAAYKLGDDHVFAQWIKGDYKNDSMRQRHLLLIQSSLLQGSIKQTLQLIDSFKEQKPNFQFEKAFTRSVYEHICCELGHQNIMQLQFQNLFDPSRLNVNQIFMLAQGMEDQLEQFLREEYNKISQSKLEDLAENIKNQLYKLLVNMFDMLLFGAIKQEQAGIQMLKRFVEQFQLPMKVMRLQMDDTFRAISKIMGNEKFDQNGTLLSHLCDSYLSKVQRLPDLSDVFYQLCVEIIYGQSELCQKTLFTSMISRQLQNPIRRFEYQQFIKSSVGDDHSLILQLLDNNIAEIIQKEWHLQPIQFLRSITQKLHKTTLQQNQQIGKLFALKIINDEENYLQNFQHIKVQNSVWLHAVLTKMDKHIKQYTVQQIHDINYKIAQIDLQPSVAQYLKFNVNIDLKTQIKELINKLNLILQEQVEIHPEAFEKPVIVQKIVKTALPVTKKQIIATPSQINQQISNEEYVINKDFKILYIDSLPIIQLELNGQSDNLSCHLLQLPTDQALIELVSQVLGITNVMQVHLYDQMWRKSVQLYSIDQKVINYEQYLINNSIVRIYKSTINAKRIYDLNPKIFKYDFENLFNKKKQICQNIAVLMIAHETMALGEVQLYKKSIDINTGNLIHFCCAQQFPIQADQQNQLIFHGLHMVNELLHQAVVSKSDSIHTNYVQIDRFALEFLQPHIAIGYISGFIGKAMKQVGINATVGLGLYSKRVLVYDQTQISAGNTLSDVYQMIYYDIVGPVSQVINYYQEFVPDMKLQVNQTLALTTKTLEVITDKTDERRLMRIYGTHGLTQQFYQTMKNLMPTAVEWVVYAISVCYEE
ncbi:Conserved_hypothetical protein [Hexamita inflata]|uniref:Uncharacterized protein n=1 Tax=Hexamita inflata TaxID=28002 RepID=A0AA86PQU0_9EUKA|nr:Conserved hypothetical protein [Hexamita inflata]